MIKFPDFNKVFEYENNFYLSCNPQRISKILAHYELFKMSLDLPGHIVECGVFKGLSLIRFAMFRDLFSYSFSKKIIGFDTFGNYPDTKYKSDKLLRDKFIMTAGSQGISKEQLLEVLKRNSLDKNVELIAGDICNTVKAYTKGHPELKISILNLDVDIYEPTVTVLKYLYPRLVKGGVLIMDDYGAFPGETKAIDDYFGPVEIHKFPFAMTSSYIIKK